MGSLVMTKEELEKIDLYLEMLLREMGQMDRNEKNGKWEMPSVRRSEFVHKGYWAIQPLIKKALAGEK